MTTAQAQLKFRAGLFAILKDVAFDVHAKIVQRTPIDTGRAKASWRMNEEQADASFEPAYANKFNPSTGAIIELAGLGESPLYGDQAAAVARAQQQNIGDRASVIIISNNLDYIEKLENGGSQQAPNGMVAVTVHPQAIEWMIETAVKKHF